MNRYWDINLFILSAHHFCPDSWNFNLHIQSSIFLFFWKLNRDQHLISLQLKKKNNKIADYNQHIFSLDENDKYSR